MGNGSVQVGITGANGAIGVRLTRKLLERGGVQVVAVTRHDPGVSIDGVDYRYGDICDPKTLRPSFEGCSAVFHLAAISDAALCAQDPHRCFAVNASGTKNVVEACREAGVRSVIYASTGYVYERPDGAPVRETHPTGPVSIYAKTKLTAESIVGGYGVAERAAVVARLSNVYGGPLNSATVIGRCLEAVARGKPLRLRSMQEVRDFLHIGDAAEGLSRLWAAALMGAHTVNLSTGVGSRISDVVATLIEVAREAGLPEPTIETPDGEPDLQTPVLVLDNSKLRELTGWEPRTSMADGLAASLREATKT